jgi:POT family proton-dependent oligopeptide transporter
LFWSLFDQTSSAWVLQAEKMNLHWLGRDWLPSQLQAINPLLILVFIPIFSYVIYPAMNKLFAVTPLRKISIGLFVAVPSFLIPAWVEMRIGQGFHPSISWQFISYIFITTAEVLVSITCLEFSYTQAPKRMKSLIMAFYLTSVTLGNLFTAAVNKFIQNPDGTSKLPGAEYYLFFAAMMLANAIVFIPVATKFKVKTIIQDEAVAG